MTATQNASVFLDALGHTLGFEAGYANDPADAGGETFRGISRVSNPNWRGWQLIDQVKARGARTAKLIDAAFEGDTEMEQLVAVLYYRDYWRPFESLVGLDRLTAKLFDTGVNTGVSRAVKLLQAALNDMLPAANLAVDGLLGPRTRAALAGPPEEAVLAVYVEKQAAYYQSIVDRKPGQAKFLKGWLRRAAWLPR